MTPSPIVWRTALGNTWTSTRRISPSKRRDLSGASHARQNACSTASINLTCNPGLTLRVVSSRFIKFVEGLRVKAVNHAAYFFRSASATFLVLGPSAHWPENNQVHCLPLPSASTSVTSRSPPLRTPHSYPTTSQSPALGS